MPKLYELKIKDEHERLKVIKEVTKDHHEGKLDPGKMVKNKKKSKKWFSLNFIIKLNLKGTQPNIFLNFAHLCILSIRPFFRNTSGGPN